jgi:hypothetical protein
MTDKHSIPMSSDMTDRLWTSAPGALRLIRLLAGSRPAVARAWEFNHSAFLPPPQRITIAQQMRQNLDSLRAAPGRE